MLFVIIILLITIAIVSISLNLKFFGTIKEVVGDNEGLRKSLYKADNTIGQLRIGNRKLSEILKKRDQTIADMTSMMETSMDLPEEGKFDEWRDRLLRRHRQPELILASTMGPNYNDSMTMVENSKPNSFKSFFNEFDISPADFGAEDSLAWAQANPPQERIVEYTETDVKVAEMVLENDMNAYLKWDNDQKIPGVEAKTTVIPALEPLSIEEKKE